ncbi:hypothetical protein GQR58_009764 [Nymphon striatum]|nr:hypothetical protein GQR58_009764 [Nymphon striatum]
MADSTCLSVGQEFSTFKELLAAVSELQKEQKISYCTFRAGCQSFFQVRYSKERHKLVIVNLNLEHNHDVTQEIFEFLPKTRRLDEEEQGEVNTILRIKPNPKILQTHIRQSFQKSVTLRDIKNMSAKCLCGECVPMPTSKESKCCTEIIAVKTMADELHLQCVTRHPGFKGNFLNPYVIQISFYEFLDGYDHVGDDEQIHNGHQPYQQHKRYQAEGRGKDEILQKVGELKLAFEKYHEVYDNYLECYEENDQELEEVCEKYNQMITGYTELLESVKLKLFKCNVANDTPIPTADSTLSAIAYLPKVEIEVFMGDPTKYHAFLSVFNKVVEKHCTDGGSNEVANSNAMELEGLKRYLQTLTQENLTVSDVTTDRHPQVKKFLREQQPEIHPVYLDERKHYVAYEGKISQKVPNINIVKFADDSAIVAKISNVTDMLNYKQVVKNIEVFSETHHLILNAETTKEMIIENTNFIEPTFEEPLKMKGDEMKLENVVKYLVDDDELDVLTLETLQIVCTNFFIIIQRQLCDYKLFP